MKKSLVLLLSLFIISFTSATCTVTFDKTYPDPYNPSSTITATMNCNEATEKSKAYTLTWTNETGSTLETDTGTTPSSTSTDFFDTYTTSSDYTGNITATLTGSNLEGSDVANVSGSNTNSLIIDSAVFSDYAFMGELFATEFTLKDENDKKISNAECTIYGTESDGTPIQSCGDVKTLDGIGHCSGILQQGSFIEGNNYLAKILCSCGSGDNSCHDEDGNAVTNSAGSITYPFSVNTWLEVNTLLDRSIYATKNELTICVNVTNVEKMKRIPMEIYHQVRCSAGSDNNNDLDRILIISDDSEPDHRGIGIGSTQMQCKQFNIPEDTMLQGRNSECYASTETWIINDVGEELFGYFSTSPVFNISSDSINIQADWERKAGAKNNFTTTINLSAKQYEDWNADGIGNIDIRLSKIDTENLDHTDQYGSTLVDLSALLETRYIKTASAEYENGTSIPVYLEWLEDGLVELELRDVNYSVGNVYTLELELEDWDERQSDALEGIENKTGTFAFNITAKNSLSDTVDFDIYALLEISDQSQVEGFFSCYLDGYKAETEIQFEHAINKITPYEAGKSLDIPDGVTGTQTIICELGFLGFGNDKDIASDTFKVGSGSISGSAGGTQDKTIVEKIKETSEDFLEHINENSTTYWIIFVIIVLVLLICYAYWEIYRKNE